MRGSKQCHFPLEDRGEDKHLLWQLWHIALNIPSTHLAVLAVVLLLLTVPEPGHGLHLFFSSCHWVRAFFFNYFTYFCVIISEFCLPVQNSKDRKAIQWSKFLRTPSLDPRASLLGNSHYDTFPLGIWCWRVALIPGLGPFGQELLVSTIQCHFCELLFKLVSVTWF